MSFIGNDYDGGSITINPLEELNIFDLIISSKQCIHNVTEKKLMFQSVHFVRGWGRQNLIHGI